MDNQWISDRIDLNETAKALGWFEEVIEIVTTTTTSANTSIVTEAELETHSGSALGLW